jgi:hypothetical protein
VFGALAALVAPANPLRAEEEKPEFPKFEDSTKDMETIDGFFTLYRDEKKDRLYLRVPAGMLGKKFLWSMSISAGRDYAGWQWNHAAVYFERFDKQLVLMLADPRYVPAEKEPVGDVIRRTYTDTILTSVPILTLNGSDPVIDLDRVLKTDLEGLGELFGGRIDKDLSRFARVRNFPDNTNIGVNKAITGRGDGVYAQAYHCLSKLPEDNGYQTRVADERIGYWWVAKKNWAADHNRDTIFERHIHRWNLRKAEPDQVVSDVRPEDQIVFYIEKTVPVQYRRYVREGILEWNKAFEQAGLRNAVAVRQQTENSFNDLDPEDVRYNFFRWMVTGQPYAMGPSRENPFTGQILDADIVMDDSYIRYWTHEYEVHGPRAGDAFTDGPVEEFLRHHPEWDPHPESYSQVGGDPTAALDAFQQARRRTWGFGFQQHDDRCEIGIGAARSLAIAAMSSAQNGVRKLPEEFLGQAIKETVMHEVGHTLGLRHNFKASSWLKLSDIRNGSADAERQLSGSVMDYNPYNFGGSGIEQGFFATPTLGPYDYWAIEYGYRPFAPPKGADEGAPKNEEDMLQRIAARGAEPGHDYATDWDTSAFFPDPRVNRWDNGRDPLDFARYQMDTATRLWSDGLDWAVGEGESFHKARRAFTMLLGEYGFGGRTAARVVGGQYIHFDHKGDPGGRNPIEPIPAAQQREALSFLNERVFGDNGFRFPPDLLNRLAAGRWGHWDSDAYDDTLDFDVHDRIRSVQAGVLFQLVNPFTINRIYDGELTVADDAGALSLTEFFQTLTDGVWSELRDGGGPAAAGGGEGEGRSYTPRTPAISSVRRALQREHLSRLIPLVITRGSGTVHPDAQAVARASLGTLSGRIADRLQRGGDALDAYSRAHLADSQRRIEAALEAEFVLSDSAAPTVRRGGRRSSEEGGD